MKPKLLHLGAMLLAAFAAVVFAQSTGIAAGHVVFAFGDGRLWLGCCWILTGLAAAISAALAIGVTLSLAIAATERDWLVRRTRAEAEGEEDFS